MLKKKLLFYFVIVMISAISFSCNDNAVEGASGGVIQGRITMKDIPSDAAGVPDQKIYLLDVNAKIDTITYDNKAAYIDSVLTDLKGNYEFRNVKEGEYQLFPVFDKKSSYIIKPVDGDLNKKIKIKARDIYIIDFQKEVSFSWGVTPHYTVNFTLQNLKFTGTRYDPVNKRNEDVVSIVVTRRQWDLFIPHRVYVWESANKYSNKAVGDLYTDVSTYPIDDASTYVIQTWDNDLRFRLCYNYDFDHPFDIKVELPFSFPQRTVNITYDYQLKKVTKVDFL